MYGFEYYRPDILRTESGGDYNALFGYQNRPGGRFQNVRVTDMTIGDILEFQNPRGAYGQYVAGARPDRERGVATPVGAYQIVGTTLRDAVRALNLPLDTTFTPDVQDRIAKYIFETQGPRAWQGLNTDETAGQNVARATMAALGRGDAMNGQPTPTGLLAQGAAPQRPRRDIGNILDQLAVGFAGMSLRPNQGIIDLAQSRIEQRQTRQERNATADWLESQGLGAFAEGVRQGSITASDALTMARGPEATSAQRNYEFLLAQGVPQDQALQRAFSGGTTINMPGAPTIGTIPPGYQAVQDPQTGRYTFEPIPGGPAAAEQAAAAGAQSQAAATAQDSIALINSVLNDPRLGAVTGMIQGRLPPLTQSATDLVTRIEQLQGQAFLQAFESLKGGGSITEREGLAAQNAIARLNRAQSKEAFEEALKELRAIMERGLQRASGGQSAAQPSSGTEINGVVVGDPY